jgi:AcrR family transcriptional regulator
MLDAAVGRFARDGYDGASVGDIAADAGVDAALVNRYFGGKEELFNEVLACSPSPAHLFDGGREGFGARVAKAVVIDETHDRKLDCIFAMLRSASSPRASRAIRESSQARFYDPLTAMLEGEDKVVRARLIGAMIMGVAISRALVPDLGLDDEGRETFCRTLANTLQQLADG